MCHLLNVLIGSVCRVLCVAALAIFPGFTVVHAIDQQQALYKSQQAIGNTVSNHHFTAVDGQPLSMKALAGRPIVLNLIFTSCYGSCSIISLRLSKAVAVAREALGESSFHVVTVGFDAANDTPQRMAGYAKKQKIGDRDWHILSADRPTISALSEELGFTFAESPRGFDHVSQVSIVDANGRVYRQIYGDGFPTPALVEPLKELIWGRTANSASLDGWLNGLKLLCTVYDPSADRYRFDYSVFVAGITGIICLGGIAAFVLKAWNPHRT